MKRFAALLLFLCCAACSAPRPPEPSGPIHLDRSAALHALAQIDADIAVLEAARRDETSSSASSAIRASGASIDSQLANAASHVRNTTLSAPAARVGPALAAAATSLNGFSSALQYRVARAVALRQSQFLERESTFAYRFERAHAGQRLQLDLKLRTLHADSVTRREWTQQLHTLNAREEAALERSRVHDAAELARFRDTLASETTAELDSTQRDLDVNAAAVRRIPQPSAASILRARAPYGKASATSTAAGFDVARSDLRARFMQLHAGNESDDAALGAQLAALRAERARLAQELKRDF
ncbi:MAG: hypothetical protein M3R51_09825 [Candidatus Eremiobacteraeota bacterium]|nr:hypothetical protein [Candidatus Eremiobacteraeota bacterium]